MEVLLEIVLEFFLEFVIQIVGEVTIESILHGIPRPAWLRKSWNTVIVVMLYAVLGIFTGFISILIFPNSFVRGETFHGISLLVTPLLAGLTMAGIGWLRQQKGKSVIPLDSFAYGFVFAFAMALIRLLFTN